jgi:transposase
VRRVWTLPGQRPIARVWPRYRWCYVVAFVRPETGATFWLLVPRLATDVYALALAEFARTIGAGPDKQVVLVIDQAGWHRSSKLVVPNGIQLEFLPAYAPELQPAERLWSLIDEVLANQVLPDLATLLDVLSARCRQVRTWTQAIARRTCFHWWPRLALSAGQ